MTLARSLAEIVADPAALEPPAVVVPRLAWRGRTTLLAAREKGGKSTLATGGAAAVTRGKPWLGDAPEPGTVLWVGLEEHVADLAARMHEWGADFGRVYVIDTFGASPDPLATLIEEADAIRPALLVIDTLAALVEATGAKPDPGSSTAWTPIMAALARMARDTDAAVLILHHARRSDGAYRDSSAIGAGVDVIVEMAEAEDQARTLKVRGRWRIGDYAVRLVGTAFELATGAPSLDAQVLAFVQSSPGCSQRAVEVAIGGRAAAVRAAIRRLLGAGVVIDDSGAGGARRLRTAGTHPGTHPPAAPDAAGRTRDAGGTHPDALAGRTVRPDSKPHTSEPGRTSCDDPDADEVAL